MLIKLDYGEYPYLAVCYHAAQLCRCRRHNGSLSVSKGHFVPLIPIHPLDTQNLVLRYCINFKNAYRSQNERVLCGISAPVG